LKYTVNKNLPKRKRAARNEKRNVSLEKIDLNHFTPVPDILQPAKPFNFEKVIKLRYQAISKSKSAKVALRKDVVAEQKALGMV
jgi:hypothetical protein